MLEYRLDIYHQVHPQQTTRSTVSPELERSQAQPVIEESPKVIPAYCTMRNRSIVALLSRGKSNIAVQRHQCSVNSVASHLWKRPLPQTTFMETKRAFSSKSTDIMGSFNRTNFEGNNVAAAMQALANADAVCFDVDSTVIQEEGIDVLADYLGKGAKVAEFTSKAMSGSMKFEDALSERLKIIEPSRSEILNCLVDRPLMLSPGIDRLIGTLHEKGIDVYLVSGGFRIMIEPIAKELCVSKTNIYANTILFQEEDGDTYAGFDAEEPTSADGGKPKALTLIKEKHDYDVMVMVGDGATDAQAKPPADAFIGFGGVVVREPVKERACWFVTDFEDMIQVVEKFAPNNRSIS